MKTNTRGVVKYGAASLCLGALVAGCGGLGAGEYATYRIANSTSSFSEGCDQQNDPNDTNTLRQGATVLLYVLPGESDDIPYLDLGGLVLEGAATDEGYSFSGTIIDVEEDNDQTFTQTTDITVSVVLDGTTITGSASTRTTVGCSGDCGGFEDLDCTQDNDFVGVQVEETVSVPVDND